MLHRYRQLYRLHRIESIYVNIAKDVEASFDTSNYELERPLPKRKKKKLIGLMKDELSGKIMREFADSR